MEVEEVLQALLAEVEALLADAEAELLRLEEQVTGFQAERYGLQLVLARRRGQAGAAGLSAAAPSERQDGPPWTVVPWPDLSRAEAVLELLLQEGGPLSRMALTERLADVGRVGDDPDAVSAALAYLRRTGRAERVAAGQWVAREATPA